MAQFSVKIIRLNGAVLDENQQQQDAQHHCKADDVWTRFEVEERGALCHPKRLSTPHARLTPVTC
jgi:hypothetical protein